MKDTIPDSVGSLPPAVGPAGQLAHPDAIEHNQRLQPNLYRVGDHAWSLVGNGLSNQNFVEAPGGIIAIDTGESVEEMRDALKHLRKHTDKPIVACIYTHFHYVNGTVALLEEPSTKDLKIYGHRGIEANLLRFGGEISPRAGRGLVHQFGTALPDEGEDALLHCGLGLFLRNPDHAPFTPGYVPAQHTIDQPTTLDIAGLQVSLIPAVSDADDSITIWFEALNLCINNLVWPSLFNIYAIRGEQFRDPTELLKGIDAIYDLQPEHLICTHGPPLSGEESGTDLAPAVLDYRDAIQFIWDQTVRGVNRGLRLSELTEHVQLPDRFNRSYFTRQFYGLVEHHVRQIHNGLFGWLDEDESKLFPMPEAERCERLITGFGGHQTVRQEVDKAIEAEDLRWAAELATWLNRSSGCEQSDKQRLATVLRRFSQQTSSANVRNWCLTRTLELEGSVDLQRLRVHRFRLDDVLRASPTRYIPVLRVLLDPTKAVGCDDELAWYFASGERAGIRIRGQVAVITNGDNATIGIGLSHETWAQILSAKTTVSAAVEEGIVSTVGDTARIYRFLEAFDHPAFR